MKKTILKATGISKSFSHVPILKNVDFELDSAETHILMGENGAGKSTLMKIITGVYQQDKGNIYLDDGKGNLEEIAFSNPKMALEKGISMVFQEFNLMENMTIAENIFMGYEPVKKGLIDWNKMNQDALKWMEMVSMRFRLVRMSGSRILTEFFIRLKKGSFLPSSTPRACWAWLMLW